MTLQVSAAGLSDRQLRFLEGYLSGKPISQAAQEAGYSNPLSGYTCLRSPRLQAALRDYQTRVIGTEGVTLAIRTYLDLMQPGVPPAVRKGAADSVMKIAGFMDRQDQDADRDPNTMTPDELAEQIGRLDAALAKHADAAIPVKTQVIEHNPPSGG